MTKENVSSTILVLHLPHLYTNIKREKHVLILNHTNYKYKSLVLGFLFLRPSMKTDVFALLFIIEYNVVESDRRPKNQRNE